MQYNRLKLADSHLESYTVLELSPAAKESYEAAYRNEAASYAQEMKAYKASGKEDAWNAKVGKKPAKSATAAKKKV